MIKFKKPFWFDSNIGFNFIDSQERLNRIYNIFGRDILLSRQFQGHQYPMFTMFTKDIADRTLAEYYEIKSA